MFLAALAIAAIVSRTDVLWTVLAEVLGGLFTAIVTATVIADAGEARDPRALWGHIFDRSWAVIVIGFATDLCATAGLGGLAAPTVLGKLLAAGVVLVAVSLTFAPVDALVSEDPWYALLPGALARSMLVAWRGVVFSRALIAFTLGYVGAIWVYLGLGAALGHLHTPHVGMWASGLSTVLLLPPVQTFAALIYLDAIGYVPPRTCGR